MRDEEDEEEEESTAAAENGDLLRSKEQIGCDHPENVLFDDSFLGRRRRGSHGGGGDDDDGTTRRRFPRTKRRTTRTCTDTKSRAENVTRRSDQYFDGCGSKGK